MNASTNHSTELVQAAASIVAAFAGNPSPKVEASELANLFTTVHSALAGTSAPAGGEEAASQASSPEAEAVAEMIDEQVNQEGNTRLPVAARESLAGSVVYANEGDYDPAQVWPEATEEQRAKFMALIEKHNIQRNGADGRPIPRLPVEKLVTPWKVFDPISGSPFTMLKRHLSGSYGLDINELRIMFNLGDDFPQTAPLYSESKRKDAERTGLGRGSREEKAARAAAKRAAEGKTKAAAAKPAAAKTVAKSKAPAKTTAKAPATAKAKTAGKSGSAKTTAKSARREPVTA